MDWVSDDYPLRTVLPWDEDRWTKSMKGLDDRFPSLSSVPETEIRFSVTKSPWQLMR